MYHYSFNILLNQCSHYSKNQNVFDFHSVFQLTLINFLSSAFKIEKEFLSKNQKALTKITTEYL